MAAKKSVQWLEEQEEWSDDFDEEGEEEDETVEADLLVTARDRLTKLRAMDSADVLKKTEKGVLPLKEGARELDEMLEGEDDSGARKKIIKKDRLLVNCLENRRACGGIYYEHHSAARTSGAREPDQA